MAEVKMKSTKSSFSGQVFVVRFLGASTCAW